jgi:hypothetical protein
MEQSPPEAHIRSDGQVTSYLLWKTEVHYLVHKGPLLVLDPILRHMDSVHILTA